MISPKIRLVKSPSTGNIEIEIHDSIYMIPNRVVLIPEGGLLLEDPISRYKERIAQLEHELDKAKRAKKYILKNIKGA